MTAVTVTWQQVVTASIVIVILFSITTGKIRYDLTAFAGLLLIAVLKIVPVTSIFSGFSNPALFTVGSVMILSQGLINSGLFNGWGQWIGKKVRKPKSQVLILSVITAVLSTFMNNIGAIGIMLPTSKRMAKRCQLPHAAYGVPLVYASILGGSITLIGTASNIIVSSYRFSELGESFRMFDFAAHGVAMLLSGISLWLFCQICGYKPLRLNHVDNRINDQEKIVTGSLKKKLTALISMLLVIISTSLGWIHSAVGFGFVIVIFGISKIMSPKEIYASLGMHIIIFIGSMISIGRILDEIGILDLIVNAVIPIFDMVPPILVIYLMMILAAIIANAVDNSVSAVLLSPIVISLALQGNIGVSADALLMAVAAGASLGFILPTHQVTLLAMNRIDDFPRKKFIGNGFVIAVVASIAATIVINIIWN